MRVRLFGVFAHMAGVNELTLEVKTPRPVGEVLKEVIPRYEEFQNKIIIVNGKPSSEEVLVGNGDEVKVLPVLSGG
ncbi:MAG: MoaD/ThiS family protein [Zestosphaera sp.]